MLEVKIQTRQRGRNNCQVNKAGIFHLSTNNVKQTDYHFFDKIARGRQDDPMCSYYQLTKERDIFIEIYTKTIQHMIKQ